MTPWEGFVIALAAWRVASLLVTEDGPLEVFAGIRALAGIPRPGDMSVREVPVLAGILSCVWCCSVWTAAGAWACWEYLAHWPIYGLALSAGAIIVEANVRK